MNLPADEMLRLAKKVYPDNQWWIPKGKDVPFNEFSRPFRPSTEGSGDRAAAQALDCILTAEESPQHQQYRDHVANGMPSFQAAISALLANSSAGGKP